MVLKKMGGSDAKTYKVGGMGGSRLRHSCSDYPGGQHCESNQLFSISCTVANINVQTKVDGMSHLISLDSLY